MTTPAPDLLHLRPAGVSVLHWGADLGDVPATELGALAVASIPAHQRPRLR